MSTICLQVGLDSSLEFTSFEGDMSPEEEARLLEELANTRDELKNMKLRQAMVRIDEKGRSQLPDKPVTSSSCTRVENKKPIFKKYSQV